jgi:hypothetical protein
MGAPAHNNVQTQIGRHVFCGQVYNTDTMDPVKAKQMPLPKNVCTDRYAQALYPNNKM